MSLITLTPYQSLISHIHSLITTQLEYYEILTLEHRYEPELIKAEKKEDEDITKQQKEQDDVESKDDAMASPLARFLISRAVKSPILGNYLHWYLVAEFSAPTKDDREVALFMRVHEAFLNSLEGSGQTVGTFFCVSVFLFYYLTRNYNTGIMQQTTLLKKLFMLGTEQKKLGGSTLFCLSVCFPPFKEQHQHQQVSRRKNEECVKNFHPVVSMKI